MGERRPSGRRAEQGSGGRSRRKREPRSRSVGNLSPASSYVDGRGGANRTVCVRDGSASSREAWDEPVFEVGGCDSGGGPGVRILARPDDRDRERGDERRAGDWISTWGIAVLGATGGSPRSYSWAYEPGPRATANGVAGRVRSATGRTDDPALSVSTKWNRRGRRQRFVYGFSISADGRSFAFGSEVHQLVAGDTNHIRGRLRPRSPDGTDRAREPLDRRACRPIMVPRSPPSRPMVCSWLSRANPRASTGRYQRKLGRLRARPSRTARPSWSAWPTGKLAGLGQSVLPSIICGRPIRGLREADPPSSSRDTNSSDDIFSPTIDRPARP
jgi:hypothetical protein